MRTLPTLKKPLTKLEEQGYVTQYLGGSKEAGEMLLRDNAETIGFLAWTYSQNEAQYDELFNEGVIGFLEGLYSYVPGVKLKTFLHKKVKGSMLDSLRRQGYHSISGPGLVRKASIYFRLEADSFRKGEKFNPAAHGFSARDELEIHYSTEPLDTPDSYEPIGLSNPEEQLELDQYKDVLSGLFQSCLTERERYTIIRKFGLDGRDPQNLEQIASDIGVGPSMVSMNITDGIKMLHSKLSRICPN